MSVPLRDDWRFKIAHEVRELYRFGLAQTGGNVSVRCGNRILITPRGVSQNAPYAFRADDIVECSSEGTAIDATRTPSREVLVHSTMYAEMAWANAIMHAHPAEVVGTSTDGQQIPPVTEAGFKMPNPYRIGNARYLSNAELTSVVSSAECREWMGKTTGNQYGEWILVERHGVFVAARSLDEARYFLFKIVENARAYLGWLSVGRR